MRLNYQLEYGRDSVNGNCSNTLTDYDQWMTCLMKLNEAQFLNGSWDK